LLDARCRGQFRLYDRTIGRSRHDSPKLTELARKQAMQTCACCPALTQCRDWFDSLLPDQRPFGVVAGQLNTRRCPA
jgi:WhiB family transcriptional regulator, redox-sensing transcriptional regulator